MCAVGYPILHVFNKNTTAVINQTQKMNPAIILSEDVEIIMGEGRSPLRAVRTD